jgi:hypothetical protein
MGAAPQVKGALKFDIEVVKGPHTGLKMSFSKDSVSIGRGPENDIILSSDPRVSRQHAEIKRRLNSEFVVVNLSGKNYIMVNGHMVESELLMNDAVILIGDTEIVFNVETSVTTSSGSSEFPPAKAPAAGPLVGLASAVPSISPQMPSSPSPQMPQMPSPLSPQMPQMAQMPQMPQMPSAATYPPGPSMGYGEGPRLGGGGGLLQNPKVRFYGIIGILVLVGFFLFSPSNGKKGKDPNEIRTSTISMQDAVDAEKRTQELLTIKKEKYDSVQYRRAQENFVKGFRDFQQGQYSRAREAFQVVLNLDPDNELAKRYYHLSKIKFDELVKFNMIQGNRYREKKNWRMCQSNYSNVMTMLLNRKDDPSFKEAKQFYDECTLNLEGRF